MIIICDYTILKFSNCCTYQIIDILLNLRLRMSVASISCSHLLTSKSYMKKVKKSHS